MDLTQPGGIGGGIMAPIRQQGEAMPAWSPSLQQAIPPRDDDRGEGSVCDEMAAPPVGPPPAGGVSLSTRFSTHPPPDRPGGDPIHQVHQVCRSGSSLHDSIALLLARLRLVLHQSSDIFHPSGKVYGNRVDSRVIACEAKRFNIPCTRQAADLLFRAVCVTEVERRAGFVEAKTFEMRMMLTSARDSLATHTSLPTHNSLRARRSITAYY